MSQLELWGHLGKHVFKFGTEPALYSLAYLASHLYVSYYMFIEESLSHNFIFLLKL